jgi:flagellar FliJ protein
MQKVLPMLIDQARTVRDQQAARLQQAQGALQQAQGTLERLHAFRIECLARSPAAVLGRSDGAGLADYQRFVTRLDEAIAAQRQQAELRQAAMLKQQQVLQQAQQRLLAFDTLDRRYATQRAARELRHEQRQSDEFAARATARAQERQP